MQFDVVTLFPEMFAALTQSGITRRALEQQRWGLQLWNPREFTTDNHRTVDDRPYGGGPGMVMLAKPLQRHRGGAAASAGVGSGQAACDLPVAARRTADARARGAAVAGQRSGVAVRTL